MLIRLRIQFRVLMTKTSKILQKKIQIFWSKIVYLFIPRPPWRTSKLQEKPSVLKREHPALQNMKFLNFFQFLWLFLRSWIQIQPTKMNADPCWSEFIGLLFFIIFPECTYYTERTNPHRYWSADVSYPGPTSRQTGALSRTTQIAGWS